MSMIRRALLILFILFLCVGCDRAFKVAAKSYLSSSPVKSYLWDLFRLQYAENKGAFLSLGAKLPEHISFWILIIVPGVFLSGILVYILIARELRTRQITAFALVVGGGLGNLYDRIFNNGYVVDFMNMGIGFVRTGIFNVADVAIMGGFSLLVLDYCYEIKKN